MPHPSQIPPELLRAYGETKKEQEGGKTEKQNSVAIRDTRPTLILDFDGVLHSYSSGWQGADTIPDPPVPGAIEFCEEAVKHLQVLVLSTRCSQPGGTEAILEWLEENGFPPGMAVSLEGKKPPAILTIDDRAFRFEGIWPSIEEIKAFKPWNKK